MTSEIVHCDYCWKEGRKWDIIDCCGFLLCTPCRVEHYKMSHPGIMR